MQSDSLLQQSQQQKSCWQLCQIFRRGERKSDEYTWKHFLTSRRFWLLLFSSLLLIGFFLYGIIGKQVQLTKKCADMQCGEDGFWDGYNCDSPDGITCYKPYDPYNCVCSQQNWCFFKKKQECLGIRFQISAIMGGIAGFLGLLVFIPIAKCTFVSDRIITTAYPKKTARYMVVRIDD